MEKATTVAARNPPRKTSFSRGRARESGYEAQSGATSSGANFVQPASAEKAPRANDDVTSQKPQIRKSGGRASFGFEFDTYCGNGHAAPIRLDSVADLPVLVRRTARLPAVLDGKVSVGRLARGDPLGPDDARVADVDHIRVLDIEPDPEADEEDRPGGKQPNRPHRARRRDSLTAPNAPDHPAEQVDERRGEEPDRPADGSLVLVPQRDAEERDRKQVQVAR